MPRMGCQPQAYTSAHGVETPALLFTIVYTCLTLSMPLGLDFPLWKVGVLD